MDDYTGISYFFRCLFSTLRNSLGDLVMPEYDLYLNKDGEISSYSNGFMISIIWTMWVSNLIVNLVVMLNFLIAIIS